VLFNLPILVRVIIEIIFNLILAQGPKLWVDWIIIKFESPLRCINHSSLSSERHIRKVGLNSLDLILSVLLLIEISDPSQINRVVLVEVRIFLQVSQHNVHLSVSDHHTKYVVSYFFNLIEDYSLAVINILLVATQLNLFFVNVDLTLFWHCKSSEQILLVHNSTVNFWNNLNLLPEIFSSLE